MTARDPQAAKASTQVRPHVRLPAHSPACCESARRQRGFVACGRARVDLSAVSAVTTNPSMQRKWDRHARPCQGARGIVGNSGAPHRCDCRAPSMGPGSNPRTSRVYLRRPKGLRDDSARALPGGARRRASSPVAAASGAKSGLPRQRGLGGLSDPATGAVSCSSRWPVPVLVPVLVPVGGSDRAKRSEHK